jgi:hypothetical protein
MGIYPSSSRARSWGLRKAFGSVWRWRGQQGIDQIDGGDPPDGIALVAGAIGERQGEMRFAQADTAKEKYVALLGKPVEVEEVLDLGAERFSRCFHGSP